MDLTDREIDIRQLLYRVCIRWRFILVVSIITMMFGVCLTLVNGLYLPRDSVGVKDAIDERVEDYELYDSWIKEIRKQLNEKLSHNANKGDIDFEELYDVVYILVQLNYIETTRDNLELSTKPQVGDGLGNGTLNYRAFIKNAALGLLGGALFACLFIIIIEIISGHILSLEEIIRAYKIRELGVISVDDNLLSHSGFMAQGVDGTYLRMGYDNQIEIVCANLSVYISGEKNVLLIGDVSKDYLEKIKKILDSKVDIDDLKTDIAPYVFESVDSMNKLRNNTNIVLVEKIGRSRFASINREITLIRDQNKHIVGAIGIY